MQLQSRPLYDNEADARAFVAPDIWDSAARAAERDLNTFILGGRGIGKTSLLRQMQFRAREEERRVAFVDAGAASDVLDLVKRTRDAIVGPRTAIEESFETVRMGIGGTTKVAGASRQLSLLLDEIGDVEPTLVLVDGSSSAAALYELFGRMRDVLWQQGHSWVVTADSADRASVLRPPADAFFDVVLELDPWSIGQLDEMIARRVDRDEPIDRRILTNSVEGADGNPRKALRAISDFLVSGRDPGVSLDARNALLDRASELGRPNAMLMAELLDRGQGSSSDEDLQIVLGITRSRITQLFRDLLEHELVVAETQRADGPGRPRMIYRPALRA
jgi:hypothetical protein